MNKTMFAMILIIVCFAQGVMAQTIEEKKAAVEMTAKAKADSILKAAQAEIQKIEAEAANQDTSKLSPLEKIWWPGKDIAANPFAEKTRNGVRYNNGLIGKNSEQIRKIKTTTSELDRVVSKNSETLGKIAAQGKKIAANEQQIKNNARGMGVDVTYNGEEMLVSYHGFQPFFISSDITTNDVLTPVLEHAVLADSIPLSIIGMRYTINGGRYIYDDDLFFDRTVVNWNSNVDFQHSMDGTNVLLAEIAANAEVWGGALAIGVDLAAGASQTPGVQKMPAFGIASGKAQVVWGYVQGTAFTGGFSSGTWGINTPDILLGKYWSFKVNAERMTTTYLHNWTAPERKFWRAYATINDGHGSEIRIGGSIRVEDKKAFSPQLGISVRLNVNNLAGSLDNATRETF